MRVRYATPPLKHGTAESGRIWLTFDDGPDPHWTPRVLDLLAAKDMHATFFMIGSAVRAHPAIVHDVVQAGHAIGNHTWSHRHPWVMTANSARQEMRDGYAAIADVAGQAPRYYRPPYGRLRQCMIEEAEAGGQRVVLWSRSAVDWGPLGRAHRIAARLGQAKAGDIVLMHDCARSINHPEQLIRVLPDFLDSLAQKQLRPALLSVS